MKVSLKRKKRKRQYKRKKNTKTITTEEEAEEASVAAEVVVVASDLTLRVAELVEVDNKEMTTTMLRMMKMKVLLTQSLFITSK